MEVGNLGMSTHKDLKGGRSKMSSFRGLLTEGSVLLPLSRVLIVLGLRLAVPKKVLPLLLRH
jgi:hypothetical protein